MKAGYGEARSRVTEGRRKADLAAHAFGVPIDSALARREQLANMHGIEFGAEQVFDELTEAVVAEVPTGSIVLEVGAATGLMTRPLIRKAGFLTALEPSAGLLRRLLEREIAGIDKLRVVQGMVEDLPAEIAYDLAVVTFTPRRGIGLLKLVLELAVRVRSRVVMMLPETGSMDWAYLARAIAQQGFDACARIIRGDGDRRAVLLTIEVAGWTPTTVVTADWGLDARETTVPYPSPRGAATRLLRFFVTGGDRALLVRTERDGLERLYGNLRTAAHRIGEGEITVRREEDGVLLMRLPKHGAG